MHTSLATYAEHIQLKCISSAYFDRYVDNHIYDFQMIEMYKKR